MNFLIDYLSWHTVFHCLFLAVIFLVVVCVVLTLRLVCDWWYFYLRYWRRYAGWFPVQRCMMCGKCYWGGFPRFWIIRTLEGRRFACTWQACWMDYCSQQCCDSDEPEHWTDNPNGDW